MFAMLVIPQSVIVVAIGVVIVGVLAVNLVGAGWGARGATGRRSRAVWAGFASGVALTLLLGLLGSQLWGGEAVAMVLLAPVLGAVASFAAARGLGRSNPPTA